MTLAVFYSTKQNVFRIIQFQRSVHLKILNCIPFALKSEVTSCVIIHSSVKNSLEDLAKVGLNVKVCRRGTYFNGKISVLVIDKRKMLAEN
jgi:hypothetical protein